MSKLHQIRANQITGTTSDFKMGVIKKQITLESASVNMLENERKAVKNHYQEGLTNNF